MIKDYWLLVGGNYFRGYNGSAAITNIDGFSLYENEEDIVKDPLFEELYGANAVHLQVDTSTGKVKLIPASDYQKWKESK